MNDVNIPEVKSLLWLAEQFPAVEKPQDDISRMQNCIHRYCINAANLIYRQKAEIETLKEDLNMDKSRLIELPCKIGDTVYRLSRQCGEWKILPRKVLCITYHGGTRWCLYTTKSDILGDNVFLTKEDAEAEVARREAKDETC